MNAHEPEAFKPVILAVDDEAEDLGRVERELRKRYGADYRIVCEASAEAGLQRLRDCKAAGDDVAVVLADQSMPGMSGIEFLTRVYQIYPTAKRLLLVELVDRTAGEIPQAMTLGQIDYFELKPGRPPNERFHEVITGFLKEWTRPYRSEVHAMIRIVGEQWSPRSHEARDLLDRYGVPHAFYSADSEAGRNLLREVRQTAARLPVWVLFNGQVLVDPSNEEVVDAYLGATTWPIEQTFDVVVVGGGPAGLGAAVYGASEGLSTLVVEGEAIGGQAGTSSLIRNYLGFARGISGQELATQALQQAHLFGASFRLMRYATTLRRAGKELVVSLSDGSEVAGLAMIIATGASYRRLGIPSLEALNGMGVFYGAATTEAQAMRGQEVYVVGGANSAGQAAMHLSKYASHVSLLVRGGSLSKSMSEYLIKEIKAAHNVEVHLNTKVVDGGGEGRLERLVLEESSSGGAETVPAAGLFVLIGAQPYTGWLPEEIERDEGGFIVTGLDLVGGRGGVAGSSEGRGMERELLPLETSMGGVFAVGDVRHGSVKRVASAVGEGAIAIQLVHEYLN